MKPRKCLNPDCPNPEIELKRSNMLYCCTSCKNQHNYKQGKVLYSYENKMMRHRKNNIKLLEFWWNKGNRKFGVGEASKSGFYFPASFVTTKEVNGNPTHRFNDFEIYIDQNNTIHITKLTEDELKTV